MNPLSLYAAIALIAASAGGMGAWKVQAWRYTAQIDAIDRASVKANTLARQQIEAAELQLQNRKDDQELNDDIHQKTTAALSARLRSTTAATGRLRDPHAASCPTEPAPTTAAAGAGAGNRSEAGGLLSADLTELLLAQSKMADNINDAYASCRADSKSVRQQN